jgi:hypothetical protein
MSDDASVVRSPTSVPQTVRVWHRRPLRLTAGTPEGTSVSDNGVEGRVEILEKLAVELAPLPQTVGRLCDRLEGVESRLTTVESRLTTVESEIVQLRADMNDGFSAIREEMAELGRETAGQILGTQRLIRVLHEDVVARISRIGGG